MKRTGLWIFLLSTILCSAAIAPVFGEASDLANGWTWWGEYGAVLLTWERPSSTQSSRIIGDEIRRNFDLREVILKDEEAYLCAYYIDGKEPAGIQVLDFSIDQATGEISSIDGSFIAWLPDEEGNPTWLEFLNDNQDIFGFDWTHTSAHYGWVPEGPAIGYPQIWRIRPILLCQYYVSPGVYQWVLTWGEWSSPNGQVVPVGPPWPSDVQVTDNLATFSFDATFGTDEAIIQVARDPGPGANIVSYFLPKQTYSQVKSGLIASNPDSNHVTVEVDLSSEVPGSGNVFWWRVGSRNRASTCRPRPWPPTPGYGVGSTSDPDWGWVWSDPQYLAVTVAFSDVPIGFWAFSEIEALGEVGIVQGYPDGTYQPTNPVTRDSMAVYISRAMAGGDENVSEGPEPATFPDVPTDFWAYKYVEYAVANDVVRGYADGYYYPEGAVNRAEMAVYVARAKEWVSLDEDMTMAPALFADVAAGFWAGTAIKACVENGVVRGYPDGNYYPESTVTRDQMAVYITRAFELGI